MRWKGCLRTPMRSRCVFCAAVQSSIVGDRAQYQLTDDTLDPLGSPGHYLKVQFTFALLIYTLTLRQVKTVMESADKMVEQGDKRRSWFGFGR